MAFTVEEFVGGEGIDTKVALDGRLLLLGKVIVRYIGTADVVLLDDVLPGFLRAAVGQIEILDVIVLQPRIFFGRVGESFLAGSAPCAPDVEQDELAFVWLNDFLQQCLAFAQFCKIVRRLQHQLVKLAAAKWGLEILGIALVDADDRDAIHLRAVQTVDTVSKVSIR